MAKRNGSADSGAEKFSAPESNSLGQERNGLGWLKEECLGSLTWALDLNPQLDVHLRKQRTAR